MSLSLEASIMAGVDMGGLHSTHFMYEMALHWI
jgi:hypothetical protein